MGEGGRRPGLPTRRSGEPRWMRGDSVGPPGGGGEGEAPGLPLHLLPIPELDAQAGPSSGRPAPARPPPRTRSSRGRRSAPPTEGSSSAARCFSHLDSPPGGAGRDAGRRCRLEMQTTGSACLPASGCGTRVPAPGPGHPGRGGAGAGWTAGRPGLRSEETTRLRRGGGGPAPTSLGCAQPVPQAGSPALRPPEPAGRLRSPPRHCSPVRAALKGPAPHRSPRGDEDGESERRDARGRWGPKKSAFVNSGLGAGGKPT
ncbi:nascent polypeptide-associated complex subunit alpha, muscle-specific form-like [Ochotona curzoniae]|uniref:nascent polypeptide-associated complex subunit alpha, muscle-specific form-like n=1 Tax=Ochotona curzoniae TaxID=130825 RepID=UPI001B34A117|nr:nascent polypeptide-associated complex subunit alpha, muscle-specific form-like [Ochotona curzoniae]